jgi:hypothetical protein
MTGGIGEAFYGGVPTQILGKIGQLLPADLQEIMQDFIVKYGLK